MSKVTSVLVVDDDRTILRLYSEILRAEGYEVWEASTGQQGLQATRERRPDLVLLDVMLPDLSGVDVCRQIKADPDLKDVFVVLFSGTATSVTHKVDGLGAGADDYLAKSLDVAEFLAHVRTILRLRETAAALRASEQRYRRLVEFLPDAFGLVDLQGRFLATNPQVAKMLGYADPGELLERSVFDLTRPEDHERVRADMGTTLTTGTLHNAEYLLLRKRGDPFPAEVNAAVAADANGRPTGVVLVVRDVTKRKQSEEAVREHMRFLANNARFLQTLMDAIPAPVFYKDAGGRYLGCNLAFEQYLGFSQEQIIGKTVGDVAPKDLAEVYQQADQGLLERPGVQSYESSVLYADGTRHQVVFNKATFQDAEGEVAGLVGVILDVTERKRAEEQIRLLADAVQSTTELISVADPENRFTYANRAFLEAYGYRLEEVLGNTPQILYSPRNPPGLAEQIFQQTLAGGWRGELLNCTKEGTEFPISLSTSPIKDSQGRLLGLLGVARDISERKRAQQQETALAQLGYRLSAAASPDQAARVIFEIASDLFDWDAGYVALYSQAEDRIIPVLTFDTVDGQRTLLPPTSLPRIPTPFMRLVIKEGPRLRGEAGGLPPDLKLVPSGNLDRSSASSMSVPIRFGGGVVGILSLQSYTPRAYSQEDLKLLQTLADQCGDTLQRIEMADSLRAAEAKYHSIVENAAEGIFQTTPEGRHLSANPALARILGYQTPEELISTIADIGHQHYVIPERWDELKRLLEAKGSVQGFEIEVYRKDRSRTWLSANERVVRADDGTVLCYEGTAQDITERKQAEVVLRESEEKFRTLFESAPVGTALHDANGRFVQTNTAYQQMLGYTGEELLQLGVKRVTYPDDIAEAQQLFAELRDGKRDHYNREKRYLAKDGHLVWAQVSAGAVRDGTGGLHYIISMVEDITERKQTHEALERAQRQQQAILNNIPDPAWLKDAAGHFLACNEALAKAYRQSPEAILGQTDPALVPEIATALTRQDQEVVQSRQSAMMEVPLTDAHGRMRWLEAIKSPVFDEKGEVTGTVGIARDITDRRWTESLLRRQRDFGIFLSSTDDLGAAAERLLKVALENEGLDCGAVYLVNSQTKTLELAAHQGLSAGFAKRSSRVAADPRGNRLAGARQATSREQVRPMAVIVQQLKREGLRSLEAIPIQHSGHVVAVLNVGSLVHSEIPRETRHAIEVLAAQAGGAIARIRAEQSMRTSRQLLEKTIHSLRAAVFIVDAHTTTIQECNPAATRMFGYSREELIGQNPALLHLNEAMREEFRRHLEAAVKEKGLLSEFEFKMKRKDGTSFPSEHTFVPISKEQGQIVTWVAMIRDITERKTTEAGLRDLSRRIIEAQEAERQRVARELHDSVNQIIASAKMRLRKVEASVALKPMARELLARCDELLVQALEENRRIAHDLRPTDLDALGLVDACRNFCRQFQARTNLVVKTRLARFAQRCPPATELNLFRIVQEALNNVGKHAQARTVRLQIAFQRGGLMLRIQDDGRGFDPHAVKPAGRKREGIGLTNIRERAAILGGTCEVVSVPNQGTAITVRVPFSAQ